MNGHLIFHHEFNPQRYLDTSGAHQKLLLGLVCCSLSQPHSNLETELILGSFTATQRTPFSVGHPVSYVSLFLRLLPHIDEAHLPVIS